MRDLLQAVKQWHFWVLCPLVLLVATIFWLIGVSGLTKQVEQNRNTINGLYQTVSSVRGIDQHPNQDVATGMEHLIEQRRSEVAKAWTEKYRQQTADDGTLAWPEELGKKFIDQVKDLRPIEKMVDFPVPNDKQLILDDRRRYQEHIANELPKLAKMVGARWFMTPKSGPEMGMMPSMEGGDRRPRFEGGGDRGGEGGMFSTSGEALAEQSLVEWSPKSQMEIMAQHFPWGNEDAATGMPMQGEFRDGMGTSGPREKYPDLLEILYAQEDLWVLQAIMNVIAQTNEGASARFNAVVKEIDFIRMGKSAVPSAGHVDRLMVQPEAMGDAGGGMEGGGMEGGGPPMDSANIIRDGQMGDMPMDGEQQMMGPVAPDPAEGRYVDEQYLPLSATQLRQVMRDFQAVDPSLAYLAVAKRVPVRIRVRMDQSGLDRLLTECANSPLTIEVRQVRINPADDGSINNLAGPGGGSDFFRSRRGEGGDGGPMMPAYGGMQSLPGSNLTGAEAIDAQSTTDITVEIYGIVYIYNPVDEQVLGTPADGEGNGGAETPLAAAG